MLSFESMSFVLAALFAILGLSGGADADGDTIQGKLIIEPGKPAILRYEGKDVPLTSADKYIVATLKDTRISGREMKLTGRFRDDGAFEIRDFHVVRSGRLYRLLYFCDT